MTKKKRRRRRRAKKPSDNGFTFRSLPNPLAGIPRSAATEVLRSIGSQHEEQFTANLAALHTDLESGDHLQLLSMMAVYNLFSGVSADGRLVELADQHRRVQQNHVELLQAILLRLPEAKGSWAPVLFDRFHRIREQLVAIAEGFDLKRLTQLPDDASDDTRFLILLQERLRIHTHRVRNWGYLKHVTGTALALYRDLDALYSSSIGLTATQLIGLFQYLFTETQRRVNDHQGKIRSALCGKTTSDLATRYCSIFGMDGDQAADIVRILDEHSASTQAVRLMLLGHSDLTLPSLFAFDCEHLSALIYATPAQVEQALQHLSLTWGALANAELEFFFLNNPVWTKPMVSLGGGRFFCAMPQLFFSFVFRTLEDLLTSDVAKVACSNRRASYLEMRVTEILEAGLPGATVAPAVTWRSDDVQYETDLLVRFDSYLIIVEAKSGAISLPALRGAPERVKRHLTDLLIEPSLQSQRLEQLLSRAIVGIEPFPFVEPPPFELSGIRRILRVSVTLEEFAMLQSNIANFQGLNWLPTDFQPCPTICLSDLEVLVELLIEPGELLYYLERRAFLEKEVHYVGDEMDLLGWYIDTGFDLATTNLQGGPVFVVGKSVTVDDYYLRTEQGISCKKPARQLTPLWRTILGKLAVKRPRAWSEAACMLLSVSWSNQKNVSKRVQKGQAQILRSKVESAATLLRSDSSDDAIVFLVLPASDQPTRNDQLRRVIFDAQRKTTAKRVLGIALVPYRDQLECTGVILLDGAAEPSGGAVT